MGLGGIRAGRCRLRGIGVPSIGGHVIVSDAAAILEGSRPMPT